MKLLALETSTKNFSVATSQEGRIIRHRNVTLTKILDSSIIPAIKKILKESRMSLTDLDGFAVGLGPGSFTSLRVGLATVKALVMATGKPAVGIPSLDVLAAGVAGVDCDEICVLCDARRQLVYACVFDKTDRGLKRRGDYRLTAVKDILDDVRGRTLFVGDGVGLYREAIAAHYSARKRPAGAQAIFADERFWYPQAGDLSALASGRFAKKEYDDIETLVPLYLYTQDCQVVR